VTLFGLTTYVLCIKLWLLWRYYSRLLIGLYSRLGGKIKASAVYTQAVLLRRLRRYIREDFRFFLPATFLTVFT